MTVTSVEQAQERMVQLERNDTQLRALVGELLLSLRAIERSTRHAEPGSRLENVHECAREALVRASATVVPE